MNRLFAIFYILLVMVIVEVSFASGGIYTDKKKDWAIRGSEMMVVCITDFLTSTTKSFGPAKISRAVSGDDTILLSGADGKEYSIESGLCYLEQTTKEPVAREEFLESIHSVECNYSLLSFSNSDFRIMGQNKFYASVKKLSDGSVFIFSKKLCKMKQTAPRIDFIAREKDRAVHSGPKLEDF